MNKNIIEMKTKQKKIKTLNSISNQVEMQINEMQQIKGGGESASQDKVVKFKAGSELAGSVQ